MRFTVVGVAMCAANLERVSKRYRLECAVLPDERQQKFDGVLKV